MTGPNGSSSVITVATCTLNQWALDFDGNAERIAKSCILAKNAGATYRLGPELEISGYGCEDHFLEADTFAHCWESLVELLTVRKVTENLLCDFGMPVLFHGIRYNCRILCYNGKILLVRPKTSMADDGNYRESRYFTAYIPPSSSGSGGQEQLLLPPFVQEALGQRRVPFGLRSIQTNDGVMIGCESCEELWTPKATHIELALTGVEIMGNGSGSHHELRKLSQRLELMVSATRKCGGVYLYSNQRGCDGGRCYYDGGAIIVCNGQVLAQAKQFALHDVEVITATVDLDDVRSYRASIPSFGIQAVRQHTATSASAANGGSSLIVDCPELHLLDPSATLTLPASHAKRGFQVGGDAKNKNNPMMDEGLSSILNIHSPQEECCLGPACWLWDYLRRSGASGFLLPLSGGADSSSVATIVSAMCHLAYQAGIVDGDEQVLADIRKICRISNDKEDDDDSKKMPDSPQALANHLFHTVFMGTKHSSEATTSRASRLGGAIGSYHLTVPIDQMVSAMLAVFTLTTGKTPQFEQNGGSMTEDLALQNIQARLRMVTAYLFAQLLPWCRGKGGFLLVLGSANVDEGLRGYMTKYDCSSADLNPIGAISKTDLKRMLQWASVEYEMPVLQEIAGAPPTAELRPQQQQQQQEGGIEGEPEEMAEHSQLDEEEMGMTYDELSWFGKLRKLSRCGPVSMYRKLVVLWGQTTKYALSPTTVAEKVQRFFYYYSVNRHKMCTLTPSYHAEGYSPDDNRFDLRPFLYNTKWPRQFRIMKEMAAKDEQRQTEPMSKKAKVEHTATG